MCSTIDPNLAATVKVNWIEEDKIVMNNQSDTDPFELIDLEQECASATTSFTIDTGDKPYHVIHVRAEDIVGPGGRGTAKLNLCAEEAHLEAYIFDEYPYNVLNWEQNRDFGIGAVMSWLFKGNVAADYSCTYPDCHIEAVQVVQNENSDLHIAEIEIYETIGGFVCTELKIQTAKRSVSISN